MAIVQKNLYLPGQNLSNLANNVDYNRYQNFLGTITVDFGVSPAEVTIKQGTIIEVNGNLYAIETADYTFAMANASHNFITFTDNPATAFSSAAAIGTYSATKQGYYQAGNLIRTLPFFIDQVQETYWFLINEFDKGLVMRSSDLSHVFAYTDAAQAISGGYLWPFNLELHDFNSDWDIVNYRFTAPSNGVYSIKASLTFQDAGAGGSYSDVRVDGAAYLRIRNTATTGNFINATIYLSAGQTVDFYSTAIGGNFTTTVDGGAAPYRNWACIDKLI